MIQVLKFITVTSLYQKLYTLTLIQITRENSILLNLKFNLQTKVLLLSLTLTNSW